MNQITRVSEMHLSEAIEVLHTNEEKRIQTIKNQYEEKLSMSRKSHRIEREQQCFEVQAQSRSLEEKLESYYKDKLVQANMEIEKYVEMSKVQDQILYESQQSNERVERMLHEAKDKYLTYKAAMESKISRMKEKLECKRVYGIWTRFQIAQLRKNRRLAEQALINKQKEIEKIFLEVKELKSKLSTSMKIRQGLEKAFEKRAEIRGLPNNALAMRLQQRRRLSSLTKKPTPRSGNRGGERKNGVNIGIQAVLLREDGGAETKDAEVDASPSCSCQEMIHSKSTQMMLKAIMPQEIFIYCRKQLENVLSQNVAYRRLLPGETYDMLWSPSRRDMMLNKHLLDIEFLHDLKIPKDLLGSKSLSESTESSQG